MPYFCTSGKTISANKRVKVTSSRGQEQKEIIIKKETIIAIIEYTQIAKRLKDIFYFSPMSPHRSTARSNTASYTCRDYINKLTIPQSRTNYLRNSFRYSSAVLWNSLPETLTKGKVFKIFL